LFNRIAGRRKAITESASGTTRDRVHAQCRHIKANFDLIDTGGFMQEKNNRIADLVAKQIKMAIDQADVLLFVCDAQEGVVSLDEEISIRLRKAGKKILLAANKADNAKLRGDCLDFYQLGFEKVYPISATHGTGINDLLDMAIEGFSHTDEPAEIDHIKIAIVGRPNVGKSSFLNSILKEERVIVDNKPGTTRDSVDTYFTLGKQHFLLIDTAGIRHKKKLKEAASFYSVSRSYQSIRRADICIMFIDGYEGPRQDDLKVLDYICSEKKSCIIAVNKWDLVEDIPVIKYSDGLKRRAGFIDFMPIIFTSALTGKNVMKVLTKAKEIYKMRMLHVDVKTLNELLKRFKHSLALPRKLGKVRLKFITQIDIDPPTFLVFTNDPKIAKAKLTGFIENRLREKFDFTGTPIKIDFRGTQK